jgi:hypothetical protein
VIPSDTRVAGAPSADGRKPEEVEVVLNSGRGDEKAISATTLSIDRAGSLSLGEALFRRLFLKPRYRCWEAVDS